MRAKGGRHRTWALRRRAFERRETEARARGWVGRWPPQKPQIDSAVDCEHYLSRLEAGEQRAGFLSALAINLTKLCEEPEHFRRFGTALLVAAENPRNTHRTRLRAVQAAFKLMRSGIVRMRRLARSRNATPDEVKRQLAASLLAFADALGADGWARLARVMGGLVDDARTTSDLARTVVAGLRMAVNTLEILHDLRVLERYRYHFEPAEPAATDEQLAEACRGLTEFAARAEADLKMGARGKLQPSAQDAPSRGA